MIGVNLIDKSILAANRRRRRIRKWVCASLVAGGVAVFPVGVELSRHQQLMAKEAEKQLLTANIESSRSKLNEAVNEIRGLELQTARAGALRTKRPWARLLLRLSNILPQEVWLVSLSTDPPTPGRGDKDLSLTAPKPTGTEAGAKPAPPTVVLMEAPRALVLDGYALEHRNLYDFMSLLKDANVFTDVSLTKAAEEPVLAGKAVRFRIQCRW